MATKSASTLPEDWNPDLDTALVWRPYARRQRRDDVHHWAKITALTVLLTGSGFATVFVVRYLVG